MKTLTLALFAAFLAAAPMASVAFAQDAAPAAAPVAAPANKTDVSKKYKVGDRLPGSYASTAFLANVADLKLPPAPVDHKWYHVTDNAYLLNTRTNQIIQIAGVPAKTKP